MYAILTTFVTYIGYGLIIGAVTVPNASGNETEYNAWRYGNYSDEILLFTDCDARSFITTGNDSLTCEYGSANDQQVYPMFYKTIKFNDETELLLW